MTSNHKYDAVAMHLASLVAHAINSLASGGQDDPLVGCCPGNCAPCAALVYLHDVDLLDQAVRTYVVTSGSTGWVWWDEENDKLNWAWVTDRWCATHGGTRTHADDCEKEEDDARPVDL